jgi:hypothetical protein
MSSVRGGENSKLSAQVACAAVYRSIMGSIFQFVCLYSLPLFSISPL